MGWKKYRANAGRGKHALPRDRLGRPVSQRSQAGAAQGPLPPRRRPLSPGLRARTPFALSTHHSVCGQARAELGHIGASRACSTLRRGPRRGPWLAQEQLRLTGRERSGASLEMRRIELSRAFSAKRKHAYVCPRVQAPPRALDLPCPRSVGAGVNSPSCLLRVLRNGVFETVSRLFRAFPLHSLPYNARIEQSLIFGASV